MICCIPWPCGVLCQLLEWIEDLEPRPFEVPVVPRGDREAVPACGRRDVAVLNRHALTRLVGARVAPVLLGFEPSDDSGVAVLLRRLADDVRVEQPAHSLRRLAGVRRRGGTSSGLIGHAFRTASQLSRPARRRKTMASSSASKCASK